MGGLIFPEIKLTSAQYTNKLELHVHTVHNVSNKYSVTLHKKNTEHGELYQTRVYQS